MYPKIAVYLDEAGEDPLSACQFIAELGITHVVLRYTWGGKNICDTPDHAIQKIKESLLSHKFHVVALISDAGIAPAHHIFSDVPKLERAFLLAEYFKADFVRISCGQKSSQDVSSAIADWMKLVTEKAIKSGITPLLELMPDAHHYQAAVAAALLTDHRRWKFLYDPVQFVLKQWIDPYIKYWALLRERVAAIDARDLKIARGYKPVGFGDTRILDTIRDVVECGNQWIFLEPSLGRRFGQQVTKAGSFRLAYDALLSALYGPKPTLEKS